MISAESERETDLRRVERVCEIFFCLLWKRESNAHNFYNYYF